MKRYQKIISVLLALVIIASAFSACKSNGGENPSGAPVIENPETGEITITDAAGRTVMLAKPAQRIVSSYYIATELLIALGCEDNIVGIEDKADTREIYRLAAPQIIKLPAVGSGKGINDETVLSLSPDLVIVPFKLKDSIQNLEQAGVPVAVINPETQEDFETAVALIAAAAGKTQRGNELLKFCHDNTDAVKDAVKNLERPKVYLAADKSYLRTCTAGMYQNEIIAIAGGMNVSSELTDGGWKNISPEQLLLWNPDYLFTVQNTDYTFENIKKDKKINNISAVENGVMFKFPSAVDPWDSPAPSSILGIMWLASVLHPDAYPRDAFVKQAIAFYKNFYEVDVTAEQLGI